MKVSDVAWAAGIVDGEGSVTLDKKGATFRQPAVTVYSTDRPIIEELHRLFGGIITHVPVRAKMKKPGWFWKLCGSYQVIRCLKKLIPFMRCAKKKARAQYIVEGWLSVTRINGKYSPEERANRISFQEDFYLLEG